jgi:hypothetical protein
MQKVTWVTPRWASYDRLVAVQLRTLSSVWCMLHTRPGQACLMVCLRQASPALPLHQHRVHAATTCRTTGNTKHSDSSQYKPPASSSPLHRPCRRRPQLPPPAPAPAHWAGPPQSAAAGGRLAPRCCCREWPAGLTRS